MRIEGSSLAIAPALSKRDLGLLTHAVNASRASTCRQKHGAVVYKGGRVLAIGTNTQRNTHPTMEIGPTDYSTHAEVNALRGLPVGSAAGATIYIARTNRRGNPVYSAPCSECLRVIELSGIKRIVYTTTTSKEKSNDDSN